MEKWLQSEMRYEGRIVSVRTGMIELDDGSTAFREIVEHPGGVGVVPWLGDRAVLAKQYRLAVGRSMIEIPAGKLEGDESPEARGRAELEEEVGYTAEEMIPIGSIFPSVGFLTEEIHLFIATGLTKTQQRLESDERIEVVEYSLDEIRAGLANYAFRDAKTVAGLHGLLHWLNR